MKITCLLSKTVAAACAVIAVFFVTSTAIGQDAQFDGDTNNPGDWNDAANWTNDTLPPDSSVQVLTEVGSAFGGLLDAEANIDGPLTIDNLWELRVARGDGSTGVHVCLR